VRSIRYHGSLEMLRFLLMMPSSRLSVFLLLIAVVGFPMTRAEDHVSYRSGVLVEDNLEFPCSHECGPFETVYFSFCVESGGEVFLGRLFDTRFNYDPNKLRPLVGKPIKFRSDLQSLWIVRPDGREFHVKRDYSKGLYYDGRCIAELHRSLLTSTAHVRPRDVAPDAVYVPVDDRIGYWTKCFLAADRAIVCFARGPRGEEFSHAYQGLPQVQTNSELAVDPIHTSYDNIVLQNGATLVRKYD